MTELDWEKNKSSHSVTLRGRTALAIIVGAICLLANAPNSAAVDDDDRYSSGFLHPRKWRRRISINRITGNVYAFP